MKGKEVVQYINTEEGGAEKDRERSKPGNHNYGGTQFLTRGRRGNKGTKTTRILRRSRATNLNGKNAKAILAPALSFPEDYVSGDFLPEKTTGEKEEE